MTMLVLFDDQTGSHLGHRWVYWMTIFRNGDCVLRSVFSPRLQSSLAYQVFAGNLNYQSGEIKKRLSFESVDDSWDSLSYLNGDGIR